MFNFIHKHAVASYIDELKKLIDSYSVLEKDQLADYFVYSVWTRAGFQNEGHFKLPDGKQNLSSDVDYSMLSPLENAVKILAKQGSMTEATALSMWVHTARGFVNEEMENDLKKLWSLIMATKEFWETHLTKLYEDDKKSGMNPALLDSTLALSKKILVGVPPERFR